MARTRNSALLTEPLFFDTDCLSAFLWVKRQSLLTQLYPSRIVIPIQVYRELSYPGIPHLKARIDSMIEFRKAMIGSFDVGSPEHSLYVKLTSIPAPGHKVIGAGEAAAIAMAKKADGILASNNLCDIAVYVKEYGLKHMTTGDILKEAYDKGLVTMPEAEALWQSMLQRRRKLGYPRFSDFLKSKTAFC